VCFGHVDRLKAYPVSSSVFMELSDGSVWDRSLIGSFGTRAINLRV
jgi:hypothetical protein